MCVTILRWLKRYMDSARSCFSFVSSTPIITTVDLLARYNETCEWSAIYFLMHAIMEHNAMAQLLAISWTTIGKRVEHVQGI